MHNWLINFIFYMKLHLLQFARGTAFMVSAALSQSAKEAQGPSTNACEAGALANDLALEPVGVQSPKDPDRESYRSILLA